MPDLRKRRFRLRRKRAPRASLPTGIQLEYYANLKSYLRIAHALVERRLIPLLPELVERAAVHRGDARLDAMAPGRRVNKVIAGISKSFYRLFNHEKLEKLTGNIARATSEHHKAQLFRQVKSQIGIELATVADRKLRPRIAQFTSENIALIKTVPQTYFAQVEQRVLAGIAAGSRHEEIAEQIEERLGVARDRAKLIARDQVLKFNGELNEVRQQDLGITSYIWRTSDDSRVRDHHEERDGETYEWANGPGDASDPGDGEHPGQGINCRCWADPLLEGLVP